MKDFDFLFGLLLGERILKHTDNLSKALKSALMSAVKACGVAQLCIDVFKKIWTDEDYDLFLELDSTIECQRSNPTSYIRLRQICQHNKKHNRTDIMLA